MTPDELETLVRRRKPGDVARAFKGLPEAERKKLSKKAAALCRSNPESFRAETAAAVAALAVCPLSTVRKLMWSGWTEEETERVMLQVLADRRPPWIDDWIAARLDAEFPGITFRFVRKLIRAGLARTPDSPGYAQLLATHHRVHHVRQAANYIPLSRRLKDDPEFLTDEVWRLFETDTEAFTHDYYESWARRELNDYETWPEALRKLAEEGHLDRGRLLDESLSALWIDGNQALDTGFRKFHEFMEPTPEEIAARQSAHRELLSHRTPHIVGFALSMLLSTAKSGDLDGAATIPALSPVFSLPQKTHAMKALRLVRDLTRRSDALAGTAAPVVAEALLHPSPDVVEAAIKLFEKGTVPVEPVEDDLLAAREDLPPTLRSRLAALVGADDGTVEVTLPADLPEPLLDLPDAVLDLADPVEPIRDLDELLDAVSHALEEVDSAEEVERIIDGISRLCSKRPGDFAARTEPILHRIGTTRGEESRAGLGAWGAPKGLLDLVAGWLTGRLHHDPYPNWVVVDGPASFLDLRLRDLGDRVCLGRAAPLLAAPTHAGGWIDPSEFLRRLRALERGNHAPHHTDLVQALLRLAPEGREEAFGAVAELPGGRSRNVRIAMERARHVLSGSFTWRSFVKDGDKFRNPRITLDLSLPEVRIDAPKMSPLKKLWRAVRPSRSADPELDPAAVLVEGRRDPWKTLGHQTAWLVDWCASIRPANVDGHAVRGIGRLIGRSDMNASTLEPNFAFLNVLFAPYRPWTEPCRLLLLVALVEKDADARRLAVDALIEGVPDGRACPDLLGKTLAKLAEGGWLKVNRLADSLSEVARVSPLHSLVAVRLLEAWLAVHPALPHGAHAPLALLHDGLTGLGRAVDPATEAPLRAAKGSGKAAKLARAILALPGDPANPA